MTHQPPSRTPLRLLLVEDSADDAELISRDLTRHGFDVFWLRVEDRASLTEALEQSWDIVLTDHAMPTLSAMEVVELLGARSLDTPCLIVSGAIGEEAAVALMRSGVVDYVNKNKLHRLAPAVRRALREAETARAHRQAEADLHRARALLEQQVAALQEAKAELEQVNKQLYHDAFHDILTGLPNRALFTDRLSHVIDRHRRRRDSGFAVLFLDVDRFKIINDSLGHAAGDAVLVALGRHLVTCLRPADTVARFSGDEFAVLLEDITDLKEVIQIAERIQQRLSQPTPVMERTLHLSASIGIVYCERRRDCPDDILRAADIAMYRAKAQGQARYQVFDQAMHDGAVTLLELETDLRRAIERQELQVYYQPIVTVDSGRLVGFEALLRWQHPSRGMVSPAEFIPIAEETGLILELDLWVLCVACSQVARWQRDFPDQPLTLSVNLSGQQFKHTDLSERVGHVLDETGFDPRKLRLEMTEGALISHVQTVSIILAQLKALGVQLHIDDFGTGYSSLSYLQRFPFDSLKIDRSFINNMMERHDSAELVRTIAVMAQNLRLEVVAEGVETTAQLEHLRALPCAYAQGYLFAKPMNVKDATTFIAVA